GIAFWSDKENTRSVALLLLAKDDGLDDNWTESTITWNNAPYNDVAGPDRSFNPFASLGELDPVLIGGFQVGLGSPNAVLDGNGNPTGYYAHQFTQAESDLLVAALTTDDHKVTIGLQYNSSATDQFALKSRDADVSGVGPVPPILRLSLVPEPTTLTLIGLGALAALPRLRRRQP
ncbi:MAG: PEP-CTERM sorting domain-containing protein, partial [Pirellulales bacterium]|nr:PEP-CTERM sorting domain-containing protein [Pirellulales bacterium]